MCCRIAARTQSCQVSHARIEHYETDMLLPSQHQDITCKTMAKGEGHHRPLSREASTCVA
jgi:hypothetical protein